MPHDQARVEDVRAWLLKAHADLRAATHDMTASPPLTADVVFHCQQAVEKALKGFLAWHDEPFRKTHDLGEVGGLCTQFDATLQGVIDEAVPLTEYAWRFRYPGEPAEPTREEAEQAIVLAQKVYYAVLARLPDEGKP